jgi:hypothetical protein
MRAHWIIIMLALSASGCRIISFEEVRLPTEGPIFVVECNYELANCLARAAKQCDDDFEEITSKNCPRCGKVVPINPQQNLPYQLTTYRGKYYFRCLSRTSAAPNARAQSRTSSSP